MSAGCPARLVIHERALKIQQTPFHTVGVSPVSLERGVCRASGRNHRERPAVRTQSAAVDLAAAGSVRQRSPYAMALESSLTGVPLLLRRQSRGQPHAVALVICG